MIERPTRLLNIGELFDATINLALSNFKVGLLFAVPYAILVSLITPSTYITGFVYSTVLKRHDVTLSHQLQYAPPGGALSPLFILLGGGVLYGCLLLVYYAIRLGGQVDLGKTLIQFVKNILPIALKSLFLMFMLFVCMLIDGIIVGLCGFMVVHLLGSANNPIFYLYGSLAVVQFLVIFCLFGLVGMLNWGEIIVRRASIGRLFSFTSLLLRSPGFIKRAILFYLAVYAFDIGLLLAQSILTMVAMMLFAGNNLLSMQILTILITFGITTLQAIFHCALGAVVYQDAIVRYEYIAAPWPYLAVPLEPSLQ